MTDKLSTKPPVNGYIVADGAAIVSFSNEFPDNAVIDVGKIKTVPGPNMTDGVEIMAWGKDNCLPYIREELVIGNNIVPSLLERKRNIICGQGWFAYKERFIDDASGPMKRILDEVPLPPQAEEFFRKFKRVNRDIIGELLKHGIAMPEFIRNRGGEIISVESLEMKYVRAGKKKAGKIPKWWWSNYWHRRSNIKEADKVLRELPVYDTTLPRKQSRFVLPLMDNLFSDGYYPIPAYWGGRHWITLSNIIPLFHEANLRHGATPRFHIIIPYDFFFDYEKMNACTSDEERKEMLSGFKAAENAFVKDLNELLTGISKTGRTIISKSQIIESMGGRYDKRIQIEEIKFDLRDEALLKLYTASNIANVSAQAMPPQLASIDVGGKGIGSGTEIRNAYILYLIIAAPVYRDFSMEIVNLVKAENGWPSDIHYAIRDAEMTTLADNPAGVKPAETPIGA